MIKTMIFTATIGTMGIFSAVNELHQELPVPVEICQEDPKLTEVRKALVILGRDPKNAKSIYYTAKAKDINPLLWAANIECESEFNIKAKSYLGYKGLGQTPHAIMRLGYEEADLMAAACVFAEKRRIAGGDDRLAWALYKGGRSAAAHKEAKKVFVLYEKLKLKVKEPLNG
jgi:hypothetical protein